jgi:Tfp pilus assembly protein PilN
MQEINLLQNKVKDRTLAFERSNRLVLAIFSVVVVIEIIGTVGFILLTRSANAKTETLKTESQQIQDAMNANQSDLSAAKALQAQLKNVKSLLSGHIYWSSFLDLLASVTPAKVLYHSLNGSIEEGVIHVEGVAPSYTEVGNLLLSFSTSPKFTNAKLLSVSPSQTTTFGFAFSIDLKVANNAFTKTQ